MCTCPPCYASLLYRNLQFIIPSRAPHPFKLPGWNQCLWAWTNSKRDEFHETFPGYISASCFCLPFLSLSFCRDCSIAGISQSKRAGISTMALSLPDGDKFASTKMLQSHQWILDSSLEDCHKIQRTRKTYFFIAHKMGNGMTGEFV